MPGKRSGRGGRSHDRGDHRVSGGLAVLNLEGLQTRYEDPGPVFEEIASLPEHKATRIMQDIYAEPIKEELIFRRVRDKGQGCHSGGLLTPQRVERYHRAAIEAASTYSWSRGPWSPPSTSPGPSNR